MQRRVMAGGLMIGILGVLALWIWPRPKVNVLIITLDTTRPIGSGVTAIRPHVRRLWTHSLRRASCANMLTLSLR